MKTVVLHGKKAAGRVAVVDDGDYDLVMRYRWRILEWKREGYRARGPYAVTHVHKDGRRTIVAMHQLITGWPLTDHMNHDGLDNRRSNLRPASQAQNQQNQRPQAGRTSRYKGVHWCPRDLGWRAGISHRGKRKYLGMYDSEKDAALAYDAVARRLFGEYAALNFPELQGNPVPPTRSGKVYA